jgi:chemotaxis protein histidine kinase CheA
MTKTAPKNTTIAPMLAGPAPRNHLNTYPIEGMRLLDGETPEQIAAREAAATAAAAEAAAKAETDRIAAEKAEADRIAAEKAEADRIEAEKKAGKISDKEAELLKDAMKHKATARAAQQALEEANARLKTFDGIDPEAVKKLLTDQAAAAEALKAAELKAAEKSGDVDRVKKMMAEAHEAEVKKIKDEAAAKDTLLNQAQQTIDDLTVGAAFTQSNYVVDELVLTPAIARQVFGPHFDVVDRKIIPFDKPRGEKGRTELLNANGQAMGFEDALKKLIDTSPDRDKLLRSKIAPGAKSRTDNNTRGNKTEDGELRGVARIQAGLVAGALKKAAG